MKTVYARTQDCPLLNGHLITLPCWLNSVVSLVSAGRPPCLLVTATIFTTVCSRHPFPLKVELSLLLTPWKKDKTSLVTPICIDWILSVCLRNEETATEVVYVLICYPIPALIQKNNYDLAHATTTIQDCFLGPPFYLSFYTCLSQGVRLPVRFISWASVECSQTGPSAHRSYDSQLRDEKEIQFIVLKLGPS